MYRCVYLFMQLCVCMYVVVHMSVVCVTLHMPCVNTDCSTHSLTTSTPNTAEKWRGVADMHLNTGIHTYIQTYKHTYIHMATAEKWRGVADMHLNTDFRGRQADLEHEYMCLLAKSRVSMVYSMCVCVFVCGWESLCVCVCVCVCRFV